MCLLDVVQAQLATCMLRGVTTLVLPLEEAGRCCISAGLAVQLLAAVIDMAMPPLSGAWRASQGASPAAAAGQLKEMGEMVRGGLVYWREHLAAQPDGSLATYLLLHNGAANAGLLEVNAFVISCGLQRGSANLPVLLSPSHAMKLSAV